MQKLGLLFLFFFMCMLTACANNTGYDQTQLHENLMKETWMQQINLNPNYWTRDAGSWFFTGNPNSIEQYDKNASPSKAITTLMVRVPDFTNVNVSGDFQVQIAGRVEHNSVFIVGPNVSTRQIVVEMINNTLYIHKAKESKACLKNVIVRINIHNLRELKNFGSSPIYGHDVMSDHLMISSCDSGNIFLTGDMNLTRVNQTGSSTIAIIGANTPCLTIKVNGNGNVKVDGHVGIQTISHKGNGDINILGADSDALAIDACGKGTTTVVGYVNLKKVSANDGSRVYVYWINSNSLYVNASGNAQVGLAGAATNMNIDITDASRFEGQYLHGNTIYARTRNWSHANISSDKKIFAAALDSSSIYIFGSPMMVSRYTSQKGAIIPIWVDAPPPAPLLPKVASRYHRSYKGE
jgi:hypothetical protein